MKTGKITPNGVILEAHERNTVDFFVARGKKVELVPKSSRRGEHTPDMIMDGLEWEIKGPKGEGNSLIKNTLQKAARQSENVIIDLRRTKRYEAKCLAEIRREFDKSKHIKRIKVITKSDKMLDF